jgi:hypothetical protein
MKACVGAQEIAGARDGASFSHRGPLGLFRTASSLSTIKDAVIRENRSGFVSVLNHGFWGLAREFAQSGRGLCYAPSLDDFTRLTNAFSKKWENPN